MLPKRVALLAVWRRLGIIVAAALYWSALDMLAVFADSMHHCIFDGYALLLHSDFYALQRMCFISVGWCWRSQQHSMSYRPMEGR